MKTIYFNSAVAELCGNNGIIKAVLINYIYNYHTSNPRKGAGHPACITLPDFVYQYQVEEKGLWERSYIHETLTTLVTDGHVIKAGEKNRPEYTVSRAVVDLLTDDTAEIVSFDLRLAYEQGLHVAIMKQFLLHVIDKAPDGQAYNLKVGDMSAVNRLSPAQIYRAIKHLVDTKVLKRVKSRLRFRSRALSLARFNPKIDQNRQVA